MEAKKKQPVCKWIQKWSLQPFFIHDLVHPNKKIADKR